MPMPSDSQKERQAFVNTSAAARPTTAGLM
jgi:hypothetical protein